MSITYANARYSMPTAVVDAHDVAWMQIGAPGAFLTGAQRVALVAESRRALGCSLCEQRRVALSPFAIDGRHDTTSNELSAPAVEHVHRLTSDPGRLTRRWFDSLLRAGVDFRAYLEATAVIATGVVVDTLHRAVGLAPPPLPAPQDGVPNGVWNQAARDDGAWVPMTPRDSDEPDATHLPPMPNIVRALTLVPDAVALFFRAFAPHYRLSGGTFAIERPQIEFVAARVSVLNECFY